MLFVNDKVLGFLNLTFNELALIWSILFVAGGILVLCGFTRKRNKRTKEEEHIPESAPSEIIDKKWSPNGWYWDEEKQKWVSPDYINAEANRKWKWDSEKRIWIDLDKKMRMDRYQAYRKSEAKEPTFEEWKAQHKKQN